MTLNSSWHWISSTRPLDLLPAVIIITLVIEIVSINYFARVRDLKKVTPVVFLANIASFLAPYVWLGNSPDNVYSDINSDYGFFSAMDYSVTHMPFYTVNAIYLFTTLIVETPIVYFFFRSKVESGKRLLAVIIISNFVTTAIVELTEQFFCKGSW